MKIVWVILFLALSALLSAQLAILSATETEKRKAPTTAKVKKPISTGDKVYTWIDKKGDRIYSDVSRNGATLMTIEKGSDYTAPNTQRFYPTMKPKVVTVGQLYSHFTIASPANDATIRNNNGNFQIALNIRPKLDKRHSIKIIIDGKTIDAAGSSIVRMNNIDRGSHILAAHIIDGSGKVVATTPSITVHLHRATK